MIAIYAETISPRLEYICDIIFREQLGISFQCISNPDLASELPIINYSDKTIPQTCLQIIPCGLLSENDIRKQEIEIFYLSSLDHAGRSVPAFWQCEKGDFEFDLFAASFYLLSRYEEYLPYEPDQYGRFPYSHSIAFQNGFLDRPLINIWIGLFKQKLQHVFPDMIVHAPCFHSILTYDIDMAWSYKHKGFRRNLGGFIRKPQWERLKVLLGLQKDPFDNFNFLDEIHLLSKVPIIYFFLVASECSVYDKNISPKNQKMRDLIQRISGKYSTGLHPSWMSGTSPDVLSAEKKMLENITENKILHSRQHYLRFELPQDYEKLILAGIENEFSMGYGGTNGFRASFAGSFFWYNLQLEKTTVLRLYPFCFMDANNYYHLKHTAEETSIAINYFLNECRKTNGLFISIFHNHIPEEKLEAASWRAMYKDFISQLQS